MRSATPGFRAPNDERPGASASEVTRRILMLSWRCPKHPQSGGAEVVTEHVLTSLARAGHDVTWFSAQAEGLAAEESVEGVRHVRRGAQWSVHWFGWRWLRHRSREFDIVIDQVNTIPFLTPLYLRSTERHLLIFQLARRYWFRETRGAFKLVAPFGYLAEPLYLQPYRWTPTITISESTAADLRRWRLGRSGIRILPMAADLEAAPDPGRRRGLPRAIVIGRLTPAKHVEEAVRALARAREHGHEIELDVVGGGDDPYRRQLEDLASSLAVPTRFHGRVSDEQKRELLRSAHVHVFASHREGWGLTVTEAAALGTPSVGYDVPGVRDSIAEPWLLAPRGRPDALGDVIARLLDDRDRFERLRTQAWERARARTVDAMSEAFAQAIGVTLVTSAGERG